MSEEIPNGAWRRVMARRRSRVTAAVVVLVFSGLAAVSGCADDTVSTSAGAPDRQLSGAITEPAPDVSELALPNVANAGVDFPFVAEPGHFLLVYFGYTSCPDVCPTTLADLKVALKGLGDLSSKVDLAMTTIDPRRDTAEIITRYVQSFVPTAAALRTDDDAALKAVTGGFGASYQVDYGDPTVPEVAHSGFVYVVDDRGRVVLQWPFGTTSKDIEDDLRQLLSAGA